MVVGYAGSGMPGRPSRSLDHRSKPVIGLTGRGLAASQLPNAPAALEGIDLDVFFTTYSHDVLRAGGVPVLLPIESDPADVIGVIDALVISGGADIEPSRYGATPVAETTVESRRDEFEFAMLAAAEAAGIPVLGICRGFQVINVHAGGTLRQHVPEHALWDRDPAVPTDRITTVPGTIAHALYGATHEVNSLHHQTVDRVGDGLTIGGRSLDGTVELLEHPERDVLAVQWHPEMMRLDDVDPAFVWIVGRANEARFSDA